jgi:hypothetical protein
MFVVLQRQLDDLHLEDLVLYMCEVQGLIDIAGKMLTASEASPTYVTVKPGSQSARGSPAHIASWLASDWPCPLSKSPNFLWLTAHERLVRAALLIEKHLPYDQDADADADVDGRQVISSILSCVLFYSCPYMVLPTSLCVPNLRATESSIHKVLEALHVRCGDACLNCPRPLAVETREIYQMARRQFQLASVKIDGEARGTAMSLFHDELATWEGGGVEVEVAE